MAKGGTNNTVCVRQVVFVSDGSGYVPIGQFRSRPGQYPDDYDYHHVVPIETWDRDYSRWRSNTTRVQREFMPLCSQRLLVVHFALSHASFIPPINCVGFCQPGNEPPDLLKAGIFWSSKCVTRLQVKSWAMKCVFPGPQHQSINVYKGVEVSVHTFQTSPLNGVD